MEKQQITEAFVNGIELNDLAKVVECLKQGVSKKIIKKMIEIADPESDQFKLLIMSKIVSMQQNFGTEKSKINKLQVCFRCQAAFNISFLDMQYEDLNSLVGDLVSFGGHIELPSSDTRSKQIKSPLDDLFGFCDNNVANMFSPETMNYCDKILNCFWPAAKDEFLQYVIILLLDHFMLIDNLFDALPHTGTTGKIESYLSLSEDIVMGAICEIFCIFFVILEEMYKSFGLRGVNLFPSTIGWIFDNPSNPLEKTITKFMEEHPEQKILTNNLMHIDTFNDMVKKTYNMTTILKKIKEDYHVDELLDLNKDNLFNIDNKSLLTLIVCDFAINCKFTDYLN